MSALQKYSKVVLSAVVEVVQLPELAAIVVSFHDLTPGIKMFGSHPITKSKELAIATTFALFSKHFDWRNPVRGQLIYSEQMLTFTPMRRLHARQLWTLTYKQRERFNMFLTQEIFEADEPSQLRRNWIDERERRFKAIDRRRYERGCLPIPGYPWCDSRF